MVKLPHQELLRGHPGLRMIAFVLAILLFVNVAAFPIPWGFAAVSGFGPPVDFGKPFKLLIFTGILCLAALCISIQLYLSTCPPAE